MGRERELEKWVPSAGDPDASLTLENSVSGSSGTWDQFATNEKLFGVKTDFNEELYTTVVDKSDPDFKKREAEAAKIAAEIEKLPSQNPHIAEERGLAMDSSGLTEEEKYSSVDRKQQPAPQRNNNNNYNNRPMSKPSSMATGIGKQPRTASQDVRNNPTYAPPHKQTPATVTFASVAEKNIIPPNGSRTSPSGQHSPLPSSSNSPDSLNMAKERPPSERKHFHERRSQLDKAQKPEIFEDFKKFSDNLKLPRLVSSELDEFPLKEKSTKEPEKSPQPAIHSSRRSSTEAAHTKPPINHNAAKPLAPPPSNRQQPAPAMTKTPSTGKQNQQDQQSRSRGDHSASKHHPKQPSEKAPVSTTTTPASSTAAHHGSVSINTTTSNTSNASRATQSSYCPQPGAHEPGDTTDVGSAPSEAGSTTTTSSKAFKFNLSAAEFVPSFSPDKAAMPSSGGGGGYSSNRRGGNKAGGGGYSHAGGNSNHPGSGGGGGGRQYTNKSYQPKGPKPQQYSVPNTMVVGTSGYDESGYYDAMQHGMPPHQMGRPQPPYYGYHPQQQQYGYRPPHPQHGGGGQQSYPVGIPVPMGPPMPGYGPPAHPGIYQPAPMHPPGTPDGMQFFPTQGGVYPGMRMMPPFPPEGMQPYPPQMMMPQMGGGAGAGGYDPSMMMMSSDGRFIMHDGMAVPGMHMPQQQLQQPQHQQQSQAGEYSEQQPVVEMNQQTQGPAGQ